MDQCVDFCLYEQPLCIQQQNMRHNPMGIPNARTVLHFLVSLFPDSESLVEESTTFKLFDESHRKKATEMERPAITSPKTRQSVEICSDCDETYGGTSTEADSDVLSSTFSISAQTQQRCYFTANNLKFATIPYQPIGSPFTLNVKFCHLI